MTISRTSNTRFSTPGIVALTFVAMMLGTSAAAQEAASCELEPNIPAEATVDVCTVIERSRAWIEEGWSPQADTANFSYEGYLQRFYDQTADALVLHDTNDPEMRVMHDARRYGETFAPQLGQQPYLDNAWTTLEHIRVEGDMALIAFTADAIFRDEAGTESRVPHFYSLGWRRMDDGEWRIFHEHGSSMATEGGNE